MSNDESGLPDPQSSIAGCLAALTGSILEHPTKLRQGQLGGNERLLFGAVIDQLPDFLFVKDTESRFLLANAALAATYGFARPDDLIGKSDFDLHPRATAQAFFDIEQRIIREGVSMMNMEESFPDNAGVQKWYSTTKIPLRNHADEILGIVGVARDITERKQMESFRLEQGLILELIAKNASLHDVLNRLMLLMESQLVGLRGSIMLLDPVKGILHNGAAPSLPRAYVDTLEGLAIGPRAGSCGTAAYTGKTVITSDIQADPLWEGYRDLAASFGLRSCWSTPMLSNEGVLGTFAMYSGEVRSPNATDLRLIEIVTRIASIAMERKRSEDRINFIAHHDALTGLPNRTLLNDLLTQAMLDADRNGSALAVVFIDLDNFKVVNDGLGHVAGDQVLKTIAARMLDRVSPPHSIIRLGGDEFVVLLARKAADTTPLTELLQPLHEAVAEPLEIEGRQLQVTCSMGICSYPDDGRDVETLLMNADAAMYGAKDAGRNNLQFYRAVMNAEVHERLALREQLRQAPARSELFLVYQPQVDLRTGRIFAVEALLRWQHPTLGLVPPAKFIPIAEESGLIGSIGDWAMLTACRQNKAWQTEGTERITVSVNVSAGQFNDRNWTRRVRAVLGETGLAPHHLEFEVTESMLMHDLPRAVQTMRELKTIGVGLSIDDFGIGYSSLSALKSFPVSRLKVDQSFVRDLASDANDRAIATAVISMGQKLGLRVIAEGVETLEQLAILRENDCDEVQGYLFSEPVPASAVAALLKDQPFLPPFTAPTAP